MDYFSLFQDSLKYVMSQNGFWSSMGFTTSIAIFVGVLIYDGNVEQAKKGTIAVLSYAFMIIWTTSLRILPIISDDNYVLGTSKTGMPFAGIATLFYITIFWLLGIIIGVRLFKHKKYKLD